MTAADLRARLRQGGLAVMFDTSALFGDIVHLASLTSLWNTELEQGGLRPVQLAVSALAHGEKVRQLLQSKGGGFDLARISEGLANKKVVIETFTRQHAEASGVRLGTAYPDKGAWKTAKKVACYQCLGIDPVIAPSKSNGDACGATVDWFIGAHAQAAGALVCGNDEGVEWQGLERCSKAELKAALEELTKELR